MLVNKIIKLVLLLLGGIYIFLQGYAFEQEGAIVSLIILILLTWLYVGWTKHKSKFFFFFLMTFTIAQILSVLAWYMPEIEKGQIDYLYYLTNVLYIVAYVFLIVKMIKQLNFKTVFSEFTIPILVLIVLDVFCVSLISGTTEGAFSYSQNVLEYTYNAVVMALLSIALINYMYRNNNKSMLFLIGCIFMTFSEIIQLAYFYILNDNDNNLGFVYSLLLVVAFIFFYLQSQLKVTEPIQMYSDEQEPLEV